MQQVSPELSDQLVILQSCPLLLRRYWADWRWWPFGEATQCFGCCHCSVLTSFHFLCFLILLSPRHWYRGKKGWSVSAKFSSIFSAVRFQDPLLFRSRKDQWPRGNLSAYSLIVLESFTHNSSFPFASHTMSFNINMKDDAACEVLRSHCNFPILHWIS